VEGDVPPRVRVAGLFLGESLLLEHLVAFELEYVGVLRGLEDVAEVVAAVFGPDKGLAVQCAGDVAV
jgi:hypothetical protein